MPGEPSSQEACGHPRVVCLGETMVMFAPPGQERIELSTRFQSYLGGAESNVAIGLERMGVHAGWIGKLAANALGHRLVNEMRSHGVDTCAVVWTGQGRVGTFFFEFAVPPRPQVTIYDRAGSAATTLTTAELNWDYIERAEWLHLTGITPALSDTCRTTVLEVARRAKTAGLKVCLDVNYRKLMWTREAARTTLRELLPFVDMLIATEADARMLTGRQLEPKDALRALRDEGELSAVVITLRERGSAGYDGGSFFTAPGHEAVVVNRLGAGDAFAAGLLYGMIGGSLPDGLRYANAMAALKLTIPENIPLVNKAEVERLVAGDSIDLVR